MEGVSLGMPGKWADDIYEPSDHTTSKFGGLPDWPIPKGEIKDEFLRCPLCRGNLGLVAQIHAPLSCAVDRVLYILCCPSPGCLNDPLSWRCLRVQKADGENDVVNSSHKVEKSGHDWWKPERGDEDLDNDDEMDVLAKGFAEAASAASHVRGDSMVTASNSATESCSSKQSCGDIDHTIPVMACFYIYLQEESRRHINSLATACSSLSVAKENTSDNPEDKEAWAGEGYVYDKALHVDRTYMKFKKRLELYPDQCLRYCYGGKPLLASEKFQEPGVCSLCGGNRRFEMQLMPPLIYFLKEGGDVTPAACSSIDEWSWMTVILYTCAKSCVLPSSTESACGSNWMLVEEATVVQFEEALYGTSQFVEFE